MIKYSSKDAKRIWPDGDYDAVIEDVEEMVSQSGKDMHRLRFKVWNGDKSIMVDDYIVYPDFTWRLGKLAAVFGKQEEFDADEFDPIILKGKNLTVKLGTQSAKGDFDERNRIDAYVSVIKEEDLPF
jgi:hypothetical protein